MSAATSRVTALPAAEAERLHRAEQRWLAQSAARLRGAATDAQRHGPAADERGRK